MDIVSYRGPGAAGGVSSGLANAWSNDHQQRSHWWFCANHELKVLTHGDDRGKFMAFMPEELVDGHYSYCNEFIWPLMHDLPEHAVYNAENRAHYRRFNVRFAEHVSSEQRAQTVFFVQDYQLALLPSLLSKSTGGSIVFWHIPWPKSVPSQFVEPISELARGLLAANLVAFHTDEYVQNFLTFVEENLAEYQIDEQRLSVVPVAGRRSPSLIELANVQPPQQPYVLRPYVQSAVTPPSSCRVVAKPLGIDCELWQQLGDSGDPKSVQAILPDHILQEQFVLSVDRADYTKAVVERLHIIDNLMEARPQLQERLSFVQICGRSRSGLGEFDEYWHQCNSLIKTVNDRWRTANWQPIHSIEKPLSAEQLAVLYRRADAMLVNPLRDGLNLTAKEYAACQGEDPGVLLLSPAAGAWQEIGPYCLPAHPHDEKQVMDSIMRALTMPKSECRSRNELTKIKLENNSLNRWWSYFSRAADYVAVGQNVPFEKPAARVKTA
jgi:trehalose 6-phosphate synthase